MTVCVIGAGGFLGRALCNEFLRHDIAVIQFSSKGNQPLFNKAGLIRDDFVIPSGCECVIYLAQSPYYRSLPEKTAHVWNVNVVSALEAARCAREAGIKRFIYASTGTVYKSSFLPLSESSPVQRNNGYALSKLHAEEGLALFSGDMQVTILRIFGLYGPGQTDKLVPLLINKVAAGSPIYLERPEHDYDSNEGLRLSLCHVEDAARIIAELSDMDIGGVINLASDEVVSIKYIADQIAKVMQLEVKFNIPETCRQGDLIADIDKLRKCLSPSFVPILEGLNHTIQSYTSHDSGCNILKDNL